VYFPVIDEGKRTRADLTIWEQFERAAKMQHYWSDNAVSCTVTFKEHEGKDLVNALTLYEDRLKTISCLPLKEHGYEQAPYQPEDRETLLDYKSSLKKVSFLESEHSSDDVFCDGDKCQI
jgi:hypothetical protein